MSKKKETNEVYATSQLERAISLSLEKPQAMLTRNFSRISKVLYFVATQLPLPHIKVDQAVKQSMQTFLDATWKEVEDYYSEIENEYTSNYRAKLLPLDGYLTLKSSSEKQFNLVVSCPNISKFIDLVVRYDVLLKKIDYYWLSGHIDDVARLQIAKLLDNKLRKLITAISIINKALITKKYYTHGFGGKDELTKDEIFHSRYDLIPKDKNRKLLGWSTSKNGKPLFLPASAHGNQRKPQR